MPRDEPMARDEPMVRAGQPDAGTEELRLAREEIEGLRRALESRSVIEQAKGVVMSLYRVDADGAFAVLRRASSQLNVKLRVVSATLLALVTGAVVDGMLAERIVEGVLRPAATDKRSAAHVAQLLAGRATPGPQSADARDGSGSGPSGRLATTVAAAGATAGSVWRVTDQGVLHLEGAVGFAEDLVSTWPPLPLSAHLPPTVAARTGAPVTSDSLAGLAEQFPGLAASPTSGSEAIACLPVRDVADGPVVRVLGLTFAAARTFDRAECDRLQRLADALGEAGSTSRERPRPAPPPQRSRSTKIDFSFALENDRDAGGSGFRDLRMAIWIRSMEALLRLPAGSPGSHQDELSARVHPDDIAGITATVTPSAAAGAPTVVQYRIVRPDGQLRWIEARARPVVPGRQFGAWVGVAVDITELRINQSPPEDDVAG